MTIQINTDHNITGTERLTHHYNDVISGALHRFADKITKVEVHISDENGQKSGQDDKKCVMEAHASGFSPMVVTCHANTIEQAVITATDKLKSLLDKAFEKSRTY